MAKIICLFKYAISKDEWDEMPGDEDWPEDLANGTLSKASIRQNI